MGPSFKTYISNSCNIDPNDFPGIKTLMNYHLLSLDGLFCMLKCVFDLNLNKVQKIIL